jgi:predicted RNase H-like nuclease (RuvC/YqgF family)
MEGGLRKVSYYQEKVKELKDEVRTKREQMEFETNEKRLAILEEEVYNTEQSISELEKNYV